MFKVNDTIQFIENEGLGCFSGKKGIIIRQMDTEEVIINDELYNSKFVYEVYVPLHGNILALDGYMKPDNALTELR